MKYGRGWLQKQNAEENREKVRMYFGIIPGATLKDCQRALGLSLPTIAKYRQEMRREEDKKNEVEK